MRNSRPRMQWPRGDYVGFGSDLAQTVGISLPSHSLELNKQCLQSHDIFVPSYFKHAYRLETDPQLDSLEETLRLSASSGLFVAAAIFRALHGHWKLNRIYTSRLPEYPSGPSSGTAEFIPEKSVNIARSQRHE